MVDQPAVVDLCRCTMVKMNTMHFQAQQSALHLLLALFLFSVFQRCLEHWWK
jgi:hypothetical protein